MSETITLNVETVNEDKLPVIIKNEIEGLTEYKKKKEEARKKAELAKNLADKMHGVKAFKTKAAVEDLQESAKAFGEAQVLAAEAQEMSFKYQEKLAAASKYLFTLGVTNMSMNRSVVRELRATLDGAAPSNLDELAQQELENVISQLIAQEDMMSKQEKMSDTIDAIDDEVSSHREQIQRNIERLARNEVVAEHHSELISEGIEKDIQQDRLLAEKAEIDAAQTQEIEKQHNKDIEHDERLSKLEEEIAELKLKTEKNISIEKYRTYLLLTATVSIISVALAIVALII